jgi:hypothetical protein
LVPASSSALNPFHITSTLPPSPHPFKPPTTPPSSTAS